MVAVVFQQNEAAYLEWLLDHPNGYVVNSYTTPSPDYLVLHTGKCGTISRVKGGAHPACFTGNGYIKVCSDDIQELTDWITGLGFTNFTKKCELCRPTNPPTYRRFNWTRDELVLALDLYHSSPSARGNVRHPGVVELSELLQDLPIHPVGSRPPNFRNCNAVVMKLGNFQVYDPKYTGVGLHQGAKSVELELWNEFYGNVGRLRALASTIREHFPTLKSVGTEKLVSDDGVEEGGIIHALHKYYERDKSIIRRKKKETYDRFMALKCEVCDFDFAEVYGEMGNQFAECHHTRPVATMKVGEKTKQSDLSIVCANCHRMLHRTPEVLSIAGLKSVMARERHLHATKITFK